MKDIEIILETIPNDYQSTENLDSKFKIPRDSAKFTFSSLPDNAKQISSDTWVITNKQAKGSDFLKLRELMSTLQDERKISLIFPNIESIGVKAFCGCVCIKKVIAPKVKFIGVQAFQQCTSLTTALFPEVRDISAWSFCYCSSLKDIDFDNVISVGDHAFSGSIWGNHNSPIFENLLMPNIIAIGRYAFADCQSLKNICMPNLRYVGDSAFYDCYSLDNVALPNVWHIGDNTFNSCKLSNVVLPNATHVGDNAFQFCRSLSNIELPDVIYIGKEALSHTSLKEVYLPRVQKIGRNAFGRYADTIVSIPKSAKYIEVKDPTISSMTYVYADAIGLANSGKLKII